MGPSPRLRYGRPVLRVAFASLLFAGVASAQSVAEERLSAAQRLYDEVQVAEAQNAFRAALEAGDNTPDQVARIHWYLGVLAAIVGDSAAAEAAFARALTLEPTLPVPRELPPEAQATYRSIRDASARLALSVELREDVLHIDPGSVPAGWVARYVVRVGPSGAAPWEVSTTEGRAELPAAAWRGADAIEVSLSAFDGQGNLLGRAREHLRRAATPREPAVPLAPLGEDVDDESIARSPWLWLSVGVVVVGAILTAVLLTTRRDTAYDLSVPMIDR